MPEPGGTDGRHGRRLPAIDVDYQTAKVLVGGAPYAKARDNYEEKKLRIPLLARDVASCWLARLS